MIKSAVLTLLTAAATLGAGSAHAGGVSWSIGINTPVVGTVISNAPVYERAYEPVYYAPAPVYAPVPVYAPAPVYRAVPPPVAYYPGRVVYERPAPVVVYPRHGHGWERHHDRDRRDHDRDGGRYVRYDRDDHRGGYGYPDGRR